MLLDALLRLLLLSSLFSGAVTIFEATDMKLLRALGIPSEEVLSRSKSSLYSDSPGLMVTSNVLSRFRRAWVLLCLKEKVCVWLSSIFYES